MPAPDPLSALVERPEVGQAVARARAACSELRWHPALRRRVAEVHTEVCVRAAAASAEAAGVRLPLDLVRGEVLAAARPGEDGPSEDDFVHGQDHDSGQGSGPGRREPVGATVLGALRVTLALDEVAPLLLSAPRQAMARLHAVAASGLVPDSELGRPNPGSTGRIDRLAGLLTTGQGTPSLVLAAIAYAELASLDAFPPVSAVLGRAVARGISTAGGLDPLGVTVPERHVLVDRAGHDAALASYPGGGEAVVTWVVWWGEAVVAGAAHGRAVADAVLAGRLG